MRYMVYSKLKMVRAERIVAFSQELYPHYQIGLKKTTENLSPDSQ
jgi:hypothetical protein